MNITVLASEKEFDSVAAARIAACIIAKPAAVIGLSTGQTTKNMHRLVCKIFHDSSFNLSALTLFGLDEITNVPRNYSGACYTMLKEQIVDALGIRDENFIMPMTLSSDFNEECKKFQTEIERRGGIDLQILGLGTNGHLGFNQPGTPFESETWVSRMDEALETRVRRETGITSGELGGLTLGIKNIMHARKIILAAKGESKAQIVKQMLHGPVTTSIPASILQLHPNCEFLLDEQAAKLL